MSEQLKVGSIAASPGERVEGRIYAGQMAEGTPVSMPVALLNGNEPGPTVYLQAVSDGDELNGVAVLHELLRSVTPDQLRGKLIVVPVVNFHAFHSHQAHSPVDNKKMNRCFPGNPKGTSSERIAYALFEQAIQQSDYCIDLHQGGVRPMVNEVRVRVAEEHPQHAACFELARLFGIGFILDQKGPKGQLAQAAPDRGIPTIDPELGGCHGWDRTSVALGVRGVRNILCHYGLLEGEVVHPEKQTVITDFERVLTHEGGFVHYRASLGDWLEKGQVIAEVTDVFGRTVEQLEATRTCILWSHQIYPNAASGEQVCSVGINPSVC